MNRSQPRYKKGDKIGGRYLVHRALMGGLGEVYLCLDTKDKLPFALKTFKQGHNKSDPSQAFFGEVERWVKLEKHPNIVRCFYMDTIINQPYMFLEWIVGDENRGTSLRDWLGGWPPKKALELRQALDFTIDICRGLRYAQQKQPGIVHGDLKPENVLISQDRTAKITDFGLGRTPGYMSPEQWQAETVDAQADVYAVGCILYELLTGSLVYLANNLDALRRQHMEAPLPCLAKYDFLQSLLERCLAKKREGRFENVSALLAELEQVYKSHFDEAPQPEAPAREFTAIDYSNRGVTYSQMGLYQEALADYERAIRLDPRYVNSYLNRSKTYGDLGRYDTALADLNKAVELDPQNGRAYADRGVTYDRLGRYDAALADLNKAVELDPQSALAYFNRGNVYEHMGRYPAAAADYGRAIELDPQDARAYANRGAGYARMGRQVDALADLNKAIELDPQAVMAYSNRGVIFASTGRREAAIADFNKAIELDPRDAEAYYNRGNTYDDMGRFDTATADYARAIELDPRYVSAYINLGVSYANRGLIREALTNFEKAAQLGDRQAAQYAARARQQLAGPVSVDPTQQAFAAFQQAESPEAMRAMVSKYPLLRDPTLIWALEQSIARQPRSFQKLELERRLSWLKQIANDQR